MTDKYKVTKAWGKHQVGEIIPESREVRRKLKEGGCVEKMAPETSKDKKQPDSGVKNKGDN
jgi:hypothetical protein